MSGAHLDVLLGLRPRIAPLLVLSKRELLLLLLRLAVRVLLALEPPLALGARGFDPRGVVLQLGDGKVAAREAGFESAAAQQAAEQRQAVEQRQAAEQRQLRRAAVLKP